MSKILLHHPFVSKKKTTEIVGRHIEKKCLLCLYEKLEKTNYHWSDELVTKRYQLIPKCCLSLNKFLLSNHKANQ